MFPHLKLMASLKLLLIAACSARNGRVTFEDTIEVLEQRIEDFNPIDEFNGVDYRASFIKFLEEKDIRN